MSTSKVDAVAPPLPDAVRELERKLLRVEQQTCSFLASLPGQHAGSPRLYDSEDIRREMRKIARDMEAAAQQERARLEWHPIATAPKDGTLLLLLGEYGRIVGGSWNHGGAMHGPHWMGGIFHPTHWMLAPDPPAVASHPPPTPEDR